MAASANFRKDILPKNLADFGVTTFLVVIIPLVYWFELFVVLPVFYDPGSFWYTFHFLTGTFILLNIGSNYAAIIFCDTSIKGRILPQSLARNWRFCAVCECISPPRSWHCNVCKTCILKRDHHCMFTSCCIGHYNLRYFIMFVCYLFVATIYATYYNVFFVWGFLDLGSYWSLFKIIFPLAMIFIEWSANQMFFFLTLIIVIGSAFTGVLAFFHVNLMLKGMITHERKKMSSEYDLGTWRNIEAVLGKRWYLVWFSPFVKSELINDGIRWDTKTSVKGK